ncbi:hypothetical protein AVEN_92531-1 [Araneus ventricosus]|uniref:Uncharacterized protein n=1 Tax=Araneus ventricosus TaxID=182803 RepID=A0A4Y2AI79_ARAVE|nr:hypothetical protein AVEN_92531-1 [Araneus ventricosus]
MWDNVRRACSIYPEKRISCLRKNGQEVRNTSEMVDVLAEAFASICSASNSGGLARLPACPMASGPLKQKTIWAPRKCGREKKDLFLYTEHRVVEYRPKTHTQLQLPIGTVLRSLSSPLPLTFRSFTDVSPERCSHRTNLQAIGTA